MTDRYIPEITPPVVNINGTSKKALFAQHMEIIEALRVAQKAAMEAFPHGRDFQGATLFERSAATLQARRRILTIERLIMDFEALALAISEQN